MKSIIIYYSRSGNTEKLANRIRADIGGDILKIEPEAAYGNYISSCLRVMKERKQKITPKFVTSIPNTSEYAVIFLGYPIWAQDVPAFISDFIGQCDIHGKIIIPFATYGASDIRWTMKTLQRICAGADIELPFSTGLIKKGNYEDWMQSVKALLRRESA